MKSIQNTWFPGEASGSIRGPTRGPSNHLATEATERARRAPLSRGRDENIAGSKNPRPSALNSGFHRAFWELGSHAAAATIGRVARSFKRRGAIAGRLFADGQPQ
jgi:hypothetical protein